MSVKQFYKEIGCILRTNKEAATRKNVEVRIEIVGVGTIKPVHVQLCGATWDAWEDLKGRVGWSVRARLAAHYDNAAIGEN